MVAMVVPAAMVAMVAVLLQILLLQMVEPAEQLEEIPEQGEIPRELVVMGEVPVAQLEVTVAVVVEITELRCLLVQWAEVVVEAEAPPVVEAVVAVGQILEMLEVQEIPVRVLHQVQVMVFL